MSSDLNYWLLNTLKLENPNDLIKSEYLNGHGNGMTVAFSSERMVRSFGFSST